MSCCVSESIERAQFLADDKQYAAGARPRSSSVVLYSKTQRDRERGIKTSVVKVKERKQNRTKQNNSLARAARILFTAHSMGDSRRCRFAVVVWFASVAWLGAEGAWFAFRNMIGPVSQTAQPGWEQFCHIVKCSWAQFGSISSRQGNLD